MRRIASHNAPPRRHDGATRTIRERLRCSVVVAGSLLSGQRRSLIGPASRTSTAIKAVAGSAPTGHVEHTRPRGDQEKAGEHDTRPEAIVAPRLPHRCAFRPCIRCQIASRPRSPMSSPGSDLRLERLRRLSAKGSTMLTSTMQKGHPRRPVLRLSRGWGRSLGIPLRLSTGPFDLIQIKSWKTVRAIQVTWGQEGTMFDFVRAVKFGVVAAAVTLMLLAAPSQSQAATGTVHARLFKAGFIVGAGGGNGTLIFQGRRYPLRFSGVSFGTIGVASVSLVGTASHLHSAADIAGGYTAAGAGFAFVGGPKVARLQNARGVVLRLRGVQVGFNLSVNLSGMTVAIGS
jgi:hypothetical protein